jgi:hypothetical protein
MQTKNIQKMLMDRDTKAANAGEGSWQNKQTKEWCQVRVTFYPKQKLWITEKGNRREVTIGELEKNYQQLQL